MACSARACWRSCRPGPAGCWSSAMTARCWRRCSASWSCRRRGCAATAATTAPMPRSGRWNGRPPATCWPAASWSGSGASRPCAASSNGSSSARHVAAVPPARPIRRRSCLAGKSSAARPAPGACTSSAAPSVHAWPLPSPMPHCRWIMRRRSRCCHRPRRPLRRTGSPRCSRWRWRMGGWVGGGWTCCCTASRASGWSGPMAAASRRCCDCWPGNCCRQPGSARSTCQWPIWTRIWRSWTRRVLPRSTCTLPIPMARPIRSACGLRCWAWTRSVPTCPPASSAAASG